MPDSLHTCPVCYIPNFTKRGLSAHKCKGGTRRDAQTGLVVVLPPPGPRALLAPPPATDPAALVISINSLHERAKNDAAHAQAYGHSAVMAAVIAGLQLIQLREATPHGQWEGLFTGGATNPKGRNRNHGSDLIGFDVRTARKYIAAATPVTTRKLLPEQAATLMDLAATGAVTPAAAELLRELIPDKSLRQYYISQGIIPATAKERDAMASLEAAAEDRDLTPPPPAAPETMAERMRRLRDQARTEWFGTPDAGMIGNGGVLRRILSELNHPADGTLPYLSPEDQQTLATDFRRASAYCAKLAKESTK